MAERTQISPATEEIVRNAFKTIAAEMKASILRSAYSPIIQEAEDFSVAIFEKDRMVASGEGLPCHVTSTYIRLQHVLEKYPMTDLDHGDVIIVNDPYWGGPHASDVAFLSCIKIGDMTFFPLVFGHWSDVGGMSPGSVNGAATEIFQEGLLIPPVKIIEKGRFNQAVMDLVLNNVRQPHLRTGDTRALMAACDLAEDRLQELVNRIGPQVIRDAIELILDTGETRARAIIRDIPDGVYTADDYMDSDGQTPEPLRVSVQVTVEGENMKIRFEGTSRQTPGSLNANPCLAWSAVAIALKFMLDPFWDINGGFFRPIQVEVPEGSLLKPNKPAAMSGGYDIAMRAEGLIVAALADAAPRCGANDAGALHFTFLGGMHPKTAQPYVWMGYPKGGYGGTPVGDGCDALNDRLSGAVKDFPVEREESDFPLLCVRYELRRDSGGPGKFRGGLGLRRDVKVLDDGRYARVALSSCWERMKFAPMGLGGGFSAAPARLAIIRTDGTVDFVAPHLGGKSSGLPVKSGDIISMRTSGGGGFGDPLERDPDLVLADLRRNAITAEVAMDIYGVVVDRANRIVDGEATREQRHQIRKARPNFRVAPMGEEEFQGNRRLVHVDPELLELLRIAPDAPVEIVGKARAPLRTWILPDEHLAGSKVVGLDPKAMGILKVGPGDTVWLRDPTWGVAYTVDREDKR